MDRWVRQSAEHFFSSSIFFVFFLFCFRIVCFIVRMHVGRVACVITCCYDASFSLALKWNAIPPMRTTGYWSSTCMRNVCATVRLSDCACGYERKPCRSLWMLGWCESFPLDFLWIAFSVQCDGHNINLFYTQTFSVFIFLFRLLSVVSQHDISYRPMWSDLWVTASYAYDKMPFLLLLIAERKIGPWDQAGQIPFGSSACILHTSMLVYCISAVTIGADWQFPRSKSKMKNKKNP